MGKPAKKPTEAPLAAIYSKRQPSKPHYLARLMARQNVTRSTLMKELGIDKSQLSRWLHETRPATPSPEWAQKLGQYFSPSLDDDDFVDIFADPDVQWIAKKLQGRTDEEKARIIAMIDAAFPTQKRAAL